MSDWKEEAIERKDIRRGALRNDEPKPIPGIKVKGDVIVEHRHRLSKGWRKWRTLPTLAKAEAYAYEMNKKNARFLKGCGYSDEDASIPIFRVKPCVEEIGAATNEK